MALPVCRALEHFAGQPAITDPLTRLAATGLGYAALGQRLSTLSGGERQRLKLASSLGEGRSLYVFDEPTTGLHMSDVARLLGLFDKLLSQGLTIIVVEHNLDVIAHADWLIEMGPGAGRKGGQIVFEGTPQAMMVASQSVTAPFLKRHVANG